MSADLMAELWKWATTQGPWAVATLGVSWACMRLYRDKTAGEREASAALLKVVTDHAAERTTLVTKLARAVKRTKPEEEP